MGHSVQTFGDQSAVLSDSALLLIIGAMQDELSRSPQLYPSLSTLHQRLDRIRLGWGPGLIDLEFDTFKVDPKTHQQMRTLLAAVKSVFERFPGQIPTVELRRWTVARMKWDDIEPTAALEALEQLITLLR